MKGDVVSKVKKDSSRTGQLELPVLMDVASTKQSFRATGKGASGSSYFSEIEKELMKEMDAKSSRYVW